MKANFFKSKSVLITGGLGYLGKAICSELASNGCEVFLLDKLDDKDEFAKKISGKYNVNVTCIKEDLSDKRCFLRIKNFFLKKKLDFIVNNAAFYDSVPGWDVTFDKEGYDAWISVLQINLMAPFFICQSLEEIIKKSEFPSIVNVSSIYGIVAPDKKLYDETDMTNPAVYGASKSALIQLTKWLSSYMAPEIRVNSISPGGIERGQEKIFKDKYINKTLLGRMANEDDISSTIKFLLSPESKYITGQNIIVDGGFTVV